MSITRQDVLHAATLARLELDPDAIEAHVVKITEILEYVAQLDQVDTTDVEPTRHAIARTNAFREDELRGSLDRKGVLANAPATEDGQFTVPKIVG